MAFRFALAMVAVFFRVFGENETSNKPNLSLSLTSSVKGSAAAVVVHDTLVIFPLSGPEGTPMMLSASPAIKLLSWCLEVQENNTTMASDRQPSPTQRRCAAKPRGYAGGVPPPLHWGHLGTGRLQRPHRARRATAADSSSGEAYRKRRDAAQALDRCRAFSHLLRRGGDDSTGC